MRKPKSGAELISAERKRQISSEGWTPEHDDKHNRRQLSLAAVSYLCAQASPDIGGILNGEQRPCHDWPWAMKWWKPSPDPIRNLVKAGALIAAEIDRLQRKSNKQKRFSTTYAGKPNCVSTTLAGYPNKD